MDEVDEPQSPIEMFFILNGLAHAGIPLQTIAPKFTGRFNKGVDYAGDINMFAKEFEEDIYNWFYYYLLNKGNFVELHLLSIQSFYRYLCNPIKQTE